MHTPPRHRLLSRLLPAWGLPLAGVVAVGVGHHPLAAQVEARVWVASAIHAEIVVIDAASGAVVTTLGDAGGALCRAGSTGFSDLAEGAGAVWAMDTAGRLCRIDPGTMRATAGFRPPDGIRNGYALTVGEDAVWVVGDPFFWRLDAESLHLTDAVAVEYQEDAARDVVVAKGSVWGLRAEGPWYLYRVPSAGGVTAPDSMAVTSSYPQSLVAGLGSLWSYGSGEPSGMEVLRHDAGSGAVVGRIPVPNGVDWHDAPTAAVGEGHLWLGMGDLASVARVDPEAQAVTGIVEVGGYVWSLTAGGGSVWIGVEDDEGAHEVVRLDPTTLEIVDRISIEGVPPRAMVVR